MIHCDDRYVFVANMDRASRLHVMIRSLLCAWILVTSSLHALRENADLHVERQGHKRFRRMVNGKEAKFDDWPFAAWIHKSRLGGEPHYCGASLLTDRWLITAAHCVHNDVSAPSLVYVGVGSVDRNVLEQPSHSYTVSKIFLYPGFNDFYMPNDDIALLKLRSPVPLQQKAISRALLASYRLTEKNSSLVSCRAAGWGKTRIFNSTGDLLNPSNQPASFLMEIKVPFVSKQKCVQSFSTISSVPLGPTADFWARMMCGGSSSKKDGTACYHDSGAPLICKNQKGEKHIHGIALGIHGPDILKEPCKPGSQVIFFLRISTYVDWISNVISQN